MMLDLHDGVEELFAEAGETNRRGVDCHASGLSFRPPRGRLEPDPDPATFAELAARLRALEDRRAAERRLLAERRKPRRPWSTAKKRAYCRRLDEELRARRTKPYVIEPIAPVRREPCACGGEWEWRVGNPKPLHIGKRCAYQPAIDRCAE